DQIQGSTPKLRRMWCGHLTDSFRDDHRLKVGVRKSGSGSDVVLEFTRSDGSGVESSYEESVRVSVQVLCGPGSVPAPDSAQQVGDCKVVRFFTEPVEP
ncbi:MULTISPECIES: hypothetical protein, partial [Microbacterium]|uniref:hypothetical protein n=1 Tax=Microbacterium TaxID=33882 RepID=UPI001B7CEA0A